MDIIKTFVFLDLETTGLPHLEYNRTRITEFCAVAVQASHIELGCFPRVHNKLALCLNPTKMIQPECTEITGLSNEMLENQTAFTSDVVNVIKNWLSLSASPICFVAHNGNRFDYPIFQAELYKTGNVLSDDIVCVDSLTAFRDLDIPSVPEQSEAPAIFDDGYDELLCQIADEVELKPKSLSSAEMQMRNETTPRKQKISTVNELHKKTEKKNKPTKKNIFQTKRCFKSYKLKDIYKRLTKKEAIGAHEAEGDVTMLITCAAVYGEKFVAYANENAKKFCEVPMMTPGKPLGT